MRNSVSPNGTATFAFTDIESDTHSTDRVAMQHARQRHDAILRTAIRSHRGRIFTTSGDAFCAVFERPEWAIAAMLEVQTTLAAEDASIVDVLRLRGAIHTGAAEERDGDYRGAAVDQVARLLTIGHGGQMLVSAETAALVHDAFPDGTLRDLGKHRLRDLARPENVFQLTAPGVHRTFPALRSLSVLPNNLPAAVTSFVGREREIAEITELLETHQLVTLVGAAGLGKTRTSLQVALPLLEGSGDGVWLIELAPLGSGDYLPTTIAHALGIVLPYEGDPLEHLVRALERKRVLLIFDGCENLRDAAGRVAASLVRGCPQVRILASSRDALGATGEVTYRLPSLPLPDAATTATLTAARAMQYAAIALFVDRTLAVDARFALTDENAPVVADICRRLDGIALAIELAASRVTVPSPDQHKRIDERFRVLTDGGSDSLPRQQTMHAFIGWSHDHLDERERTLFRRLGIFANAFTLDAARTVGAARDIKVFAVPELLEGLVRSSLVVVDTESEVPRFRLLDSTRAYALEKLDAAEERDLASARLLRHLGERFASLAAEESRSGHQAERYAEFVGELEDVRASLAWGITHGAVRECAQLLDAIRRTWLDYGLEAECVAWHEAYIEALPSNENMLIARLSVTLAMVLENHGLIARAREITMRALTHARAADDPITLARVLYAVAWMHMFGHEIEEADRAVTEAEAIPNPAVSDRLRIMETRAMLCYFQADYDATVRMFTEIRRQQRELGNANEEQRAAMNLANAEHVRGDTRRAIAIGREILPAVRRNPDKSLHVHVLSNLSCALVAANDLIGTGEIVREAIVVIGVEEPTHCSVTLAIEDLALAYAIIGDLERAAMLAAYSDAALRRMGYPRDVGEQRNYDRLTELLNANLPSSTIERIATYGQTLEPASAFEIALENATLGAE
jgi:predicted ATPase/class 3 adenylate cyclase